jgi:Ca2+/Na+ antiporter
MLSMRGGAHSAPSTGTASSRDGGEHTLVRAGLRGFLELGRFDVIAIVALVLFSFGLRFASPVFPDFLSGTGGIGALGIGHPYNATECTAVPVGPNGTDINRCGFVFDEIYFPVDAAKDLRQPAESYFDPEPPLTKLLMTPPIAWWGFDTWTWRATTTLFGALLVGVIYLIALRLRRDRFFAVVAALFVSIDGLMLVESRTGVIDVIAIFFVALFYYLFLLHWQARTRTQWRTTLYVLAAACGLAFAAKLTALAPLVVAFALVLGRALAPYLIAGLPFLRRIAGPPRIEARMWRDAAGRLGILHYFAAGLIVFAIFSASYSRYLTVPHNDVYIFTDCSQGGAGLTGTPETLPVPVTKIGVVTVPDVPQALHNIIETNRAAIIYHEQECHSHPYASHWYTWPIMEHPVLFYYDGGSTQNPVVSSITDMGNPAIWWLGVLGILFCVWRMTRGPTLWRVAVGVLGVASVVAMILLFAAAQRYHDPSNVNTAYTAAEYVAKFHANPTPDVEIARVAPGLGFNIAFVGVILFAAAATLSAVVSRRFVPAFIVLGYVTAWMMWVPGNERRVLFFYHAMGMFIFTVLGLAYMLTAIRRVQFTLGGRRMSLAPIAYAGLGLAVAAFVFFYPVWTAAPISQPDHEMRVWVDTW